MHIEKENMDFGIGIDIEDIGRFRIFKNNKSHPFLNKIFTNPELEYCFSKKVLAKHLAARFAGKEAVIKAFYNMGDSKLNYKQIEILNDDKGVPLVRLKKDSLCNSLVKLSLSHCIDKVIAFAIVKGEKYE